MNEFDEKANTWDDNPERVERAALLAELMMKAIDFNRVDKAMEYGSGTGLLGYHVAEKVNRLVLMDVSEGMIGVAARKAKQMGYKHVDARVYDLLTMPLPSERFDVIFTLLTLHHIDDIPAILNKFSTLLTTGGKLVIIDLYKEDGTFHDGEFHGHHGFDTDALAKQIEETGLNVDRVEEAMNIYKDLPDGTKKAFPLFMLIAEKI